MLWPSSTPPWPYSRHILPRLSTQTYQNGMIYNVHLRASTIPSSRPPTSPTEPENEEAYHESVLDVAEQPILATLAGARSLRLARLSEVLDQGFQRLQLSLRRRLPLGGRMRVSGALLCPLLGGKSACPLLFNFGLERYRFLLVSGCRLLVGSSVLLVSLLLMENRFRSRESH